MPLCIDVTDSIDKLLDLCPILVIVIPWTRSAGLPSSSHVMLTGTSPLATMHCIPTASPALAGSSPNVKG